MKHEMTLTVTQGWRDRMLRSKIKIAALVRHINKTNPAVNYQNVQQVLKDRTDPKLWIADTIEKALQELGA